MQALAIEMLVLGSSNCIGGASYVEKTCAKLHGRLTNLSVGACSSTLGLYQLHKIEPVCRGLAFIDFAINDNDAAWNLWGKYSAQSTIAENIRTVAARLRSLKYFPILIISASLLDEECEPYGNALHRDICERERINFVDIRALMLRAIKRGASRDALMRDDYHMSDRSSDAVASCLAALVRRINGTSATFVPQSNSIVRSKVVYAPELFPQTALVDRGSSLRSALHGRLAVGDVLHIPIANSERLRGIMINAGAKGGTVMLRSGEAEILKSMTAYWDTERPDRFGSLLIDFAYPLAGHSGGVIMKIVDFNAVHTEPTIYAKPILPGRYGEIEIEGVLLTSCDNVRYDYSGPVYDWMPLDLGELGELQQLSDRLATLRSEGH